MLPTSFALETALVLLYYYPNLLLVLGNPYLRLRKNETKVWRKPGIRLTPSENRKKIWKIPFYFGHNKTILIDTVGYSLPTYLFRTATQNSDYIRPDLSKLYHLLYYVLYFFYENTRLTFAQNLKTN